MKDMQAQYLGILVLVIVAGIICAAMVSLSWLLGPKKVTPYKSSPYECGVTPEGNARERFPIQFYITAIMFILFDIEVVFLWSWMTVYRNASPAFKFFTFFEMITYMATWILGYVYMLRAKALQWDQSPTLNLEEIEERIEEEEQAAAV